MAKGSKQLLFLIATLSVAVGALVYQYRDGSLSQPNETSLQVTPESYLKEFSYTQLQMAMPMRITVWCDSENRAEQACKLAFDRAAELVKVFSDYDAESETRRLTRSEIGQPIKVSDHLFRVLAYSKTLNRESNGAFNPTASPVIRLWREARKNGQLPDADEIENALEHVGFDKIQIDLDKKNVTMMASGLDFDFGGIAKGYIGDQVLQVLRENGVEIGCYEAGGDIVLSGPPPGTSGWVIDVGQNDDGTVKTIQLENCGISTSGDARQFIEFEGKRYSHVVDPRTGIGVTTGRTAYAIAPTGMESDALATAGCIMNESDFLKLLDRYSDTMGWQESKELDYSGSKD